MHISTAPINSRGAVCLNIEPQIFDLNHTNFVIVFAVFDRNKIN